MKTMDRPRHGRPLTDEDGDGSAQDCERRRIAPTRNYFPSSRGSLPFPSLLMPAFLLLFVAILLPPQMIAQPLQSDVRTPERQLRPPRVALAAPERHRNNDHMMSVLRQRRQSKPKETLWQLYWRLMSEGNNDTVNAFRQIRTLFSTLIAPDTPRENQTTTERTPVTADVVDEVDDGASDSNETVSSTTSTTTEPTPRRISTGELMGIFRRNVFGLGRLFGREFWNAIQESNKNIQTYSREWQEAIRPYVQ